MNDKTGAVLEVIAVLTLTLLVTFDLNITPLGAWQRSVLGQPFVTKSMMVVVPLLVLVITRRNPGAYGITFKNPQHQLTVVLACLVPVMVADMAFGFVDWTAWDGALILAVTRLALLFVLAWLLKRTPSAGTLGATGVFLLMPFSSLESPVGKAVSAFVFYLVFLGPAEEILYRGYIQSRLNEAFGRPYHFSGVNWGWGIIIASLIFGLTHVLNGVDPIAGVFKPTWWWGLWTIFSGLVYGFLREKTGSVFPSAILHGLPQAIFAALFG